MRCVLRSATCTSRPLLPSSCVMPAIYHFVCMEICLAHVQTQTSIIFDIHSYDFHKIVVCLHLSALSKCLNPLILSNLFNVHPLSPHVDVLLSFSFYLEYHSRPKASLIVKWTSQTELKKALTSSSRKVPPLHFVSGTLSLVCKCSTNYVLTDGKVLPSKIG